MKKSLFVAVAALVFAVAAAPAQAGNAGQFGLGVLHSSTPVGIFHGLSDVSTLHVGLGFVKPDTDDEDNGEWKSTFAIAADFEYNLWSGDSWGFGLFPGVAYSTNSYEDDGDVGLNSESDLDFNVKLGGLYNPVDSVALYFTHGLAINLYNPSEPEDGPDRDNETNFFTTGWKLGEFGAAFYF